jgi:hypothetical protein
MLAGFAQIVRSVLQRTYLGVHMAMVSSVFLAILRCQVKVNVALTMFHVYAYIPPGVIPV